MEEFFDLREFVVMILKKCKFVLITAVVFLILGAAFGYFTTGSDKFTTTSSTSVNIVQANKLDTTTLANSMATIKETVTGDYFYIGVLNSIKATLDNSEFDKIFAGNKQPAIADLKKVIKLSVNGNLVLIDVTTSDEALSAEASNAGRSYIMEQLKKNINNIELKEQGQQTVNITLQNGDTAKSRVIKFSILGFGGGIVLSVLCIFFINVMSLKVTSCADLKKYKLPIFEEIKSK